MSLAAAALPTWSQPELILAQISLAKATEAQIGLRPALVTGSVDLDEAIDRASEALKLGEDERNKYSQAEALVLRCEL